MFFSVGRDRFRIVPEFVVEFCDYFPFTVYIAFPVTLHELNCVLVLPAGQCSAAGRAPDS